MYKKLLHLVFSLNLIAQVNASHHLSDEDKSAYANHPALVPVEGYSLLNMPDAAFLGITDNLDLTSARNVLQTCKIINDKKFNDVSLNCIVQIQQLPNRYAEIGQDYNEMILHIDHPQWTPKNLPFEVLAKFHKIYFTAMKNINSKDPEQIKKNFNSFYSVATVLAHLPAAKEAGKMLLNPELNNIIPLYPTYEDLGSEVEKWDIKRLNRKLTDNEELMKIYEELKTSSAILWDGDESEDEESDRTSSKLEDESSDADNEKSEEMIKILRASIDKLDAIDQTDDVRIFKLFIDIFISGLSNKKSPSKCDYSPIHKFLNGCNSITPFMYSLIADTKKKYCQEHREIVKLNFEKILNTENIEDYANSLDPDIWDMIEDESSDSKCTLKGKYTEEARVALRQQIALLRAASYLGYDDVYFPSLLDGYDFSTEVEQYMEVSNTVEETEGPVHCFLYHLQFTRNPTTAAFVGTIGLSTLLKGGGRNEERYNLLKNHFNNKS